MKILLFFTPSPPSPIKGEGKVQKLRVLRMIEIIKEMEKALSMGERVALATIVRTWGSTPRDVGAKMLVTRDGRAIGTICGGCVEAEIYALCRQVIKDGKARLEKFTLSDKDALDMGMICGGSLEVFIEPIEGQPTLIIFGAGHIGKATSRIARILGLRLVIVDERPTFANKERFPEADETHVGKPSDVWGKLSLHANSYVVIVSHNHEYDLEALRHALTCDPEPAYIGMIGSRAKVTRLLRQLREEGIPESRLAAVAAPIGLNIGAETPEEIAVSILAEIIMLKKGGTGRPLKEGS